MSMTQRATPHLAAISVVLTSLLASFVASVVHFQQRAHQVSVMAYISVPVAMRKGARAVASASWTLCSAGHWRFCMLIITGLFKPFELSV